VPDPPALAVLEAVVDDEDDGEEFEALLELFEPQALKAIMPATAHVYCQEFSRFCKYFL